MIWGMYMGEIARHAIVKCASQGLLFDGQTTEDLKTKFYSKYVSEIEG